MSDRAAGSPYKPSQWRKNRAGKISLGGLPSQEDLDSSPHKGDEADRFSLYTKEQAEQETRSVRLDITFTDPIKIRDQFEMILAAARIIMEKTRQHDIGSIRQRVDARREAASLGRALTRFNGKTPYGDSKKKPRQY
jgi:hypothetical protein